MVETLQVTPLATNVQKLPYPIPPAGGEVQATSNTANVLPMGLTFPLPPHVLVLEHDPEVNHHTIQYIIHYIIHYQGFGFFWVFWVFPPS